MDSTVFVGVREFLVGCTQKIGVGMQLSKEVKVTLGEPQGNLGAVIFTAYVIDILKKFYTCIRLFADD